MVKDMKEGPELRVEFNPTRFLREHSNVGTDSVNHPQHYNSHPSGIECIEITEHMNFNVGNAMKYLWRAGLKTGPSSPDSGVNERHIEDLKKALWYVKREIERLGGEL